MDNTIIQQGSFVSTAADVTLQLRSDVDWMQVYNTTQAAATQSGNVNCKFYWQRGFPAGAQWAEAKVYTSPANANIVYSTSGGFTLVNSSGPRLGALNATVTAVSNAAIPVVSATASIVAGQVVRMINIVGAQQISSMDFTVGYNTLGGSGTTFSLDYMAQIVAGTTGSFYPVNFDPLFYPRRRFITKITQATSAVVTLSVTHGYKVGQAVRMVVPAAFGMTQMNGLLGTITAINTTTTTGNTITLNIDSSAFTAFAFPLTAASPFTYAEVVPVGEDTAQALTSAVDILSDATLNTGYIGMVLKGGAGFPGGAASDQMYWVAGKSFSNNGV